MKYVVMGCWAVTVLLCVLAFAGIVIMPGNAPPDLRFKTIAGSFMLAGLAYFLSAALDKLWRLAKP